jgi:hypothetical protein
MYQHVCTCMCTSGYACATLHLEVRGWLWGVQFAFHLVKAESLFLLNSIFQTSWPVSFWAIFPSLPPISHRTTGITDARCCLWPFANEFRDCSWLARRMFLPTVASLPRSHPTNQCHHIGDQVSMHEYWEETQNTDYSEKIQRKYII